MHVESLEQMEAPSDEALDQVHSATISRLIAQPTPDVLQAYYSRLKEAQNCSGLEVKYIRSDIGKGVFATQNFEKDDLVLKERMLVGAQHTQNKADALVCSFCFCFIGSIEVQIGRRLLSSEPEDRGNSPIVEEEEESLSYDFNAEHKAGASCSSTSCCHSLENNHHTEEMVGSCRKLPRGFPEALVTGNLHLPFSELFSLSPIVKCVGGCEEDLFCSETCAKAAWESYHSLLCTGPDSMCKDKDSLHKFIDHANRTNDIFLVAAKVISATILRASKLKLNVHTGHHEMSKDSTWALLKAWEPYFMGFKCLWWDSVALPPDLRPNDEVNLCNQMKELSSHSLRLLKGAIFHDEYGALFSLQVYGRIIGMFELNNLDLVVASPVEDYFIYLDELPTEQKMEVEKETRFILDALGDEYDTPCQGTAFFSIQSCFNHSCTPNTKAFKRDDDKDGQAVLLATRPIHIGEEVTMSYIDEDLPWEERKELLKDYGFTCHCCKCMERL